MKKIPLFFMFFFLKPEITFAVNYCGGVNHDPTCCGVSVHPFPCCSYMGPNNGNCTWWAWESACCGWKQALKVYGNAKDWLNEAKAAGWPTTTEPVKGSVFVRTVGQWGHVGWVVEVKGGGKYVSTEQSCHTWVGVKTYEHEPGYAEGFICKKGTNCEGQETPPGQNPLCIPSEEICDGKDNDCNGKIDDLGDMECGIGECKYKMPKCVHGKEMMCLDKIGATAEICDDKDNDCDGVTDENCDKDKDEFCDSEMKCTGIPKVCPKGCGDCDDNNPSINPASSEKCNGIDDNCNFETDEGFVDTDGDHLSDCIDHDDDEDGIPDDKDNCPLVPNIDQKNSDNDGLGDLCDPDDDNDNVFDDGDGSGVIGDRLCKTGEVSDCDDNCISVPNGKGHPLGIQSDVDGDGVGDACDNDMDNDGVLNKFDVCPRYFDPEQGDHDKDAGEKKNMLYIGAKTDQSKDENLTGGDLCDLDDDNDGILDDGDGSGVDWDNPCRSGMIFGCDDNCPLVKNGEEVEVGLDNHLGKQADSDGDGIGDACDQDMDGDGVANEIDNCPRWSNPNQEDSDAKSDMDEKGGQGYSSNGDHRWNYLSKDETIDINDPRVFVGGDACDLDDDNDGILDRGQMDVPCGTWKPSDSCPLQGYVSQDGSGEVSSLYHPCGEWHTNGCNDNCRVKKNGMGLGQFVWERERLQADHDGDGLGDACDQDDDNDGILDDGDEDGIPGSMWRYRPKISYDCMTGKVLSLDWMGLETHQCVFGKKSQCDDNCPWVKNPDQMDTDGDGNPEDDQWGFVPTYLGDEPCDADDDNDGLWDEDEVACKTDPKNWDSDGDGFSDFVELMAFGLEKQPKYLEVFCCEKGDKVCIERVFSHLLFEAKNMGCGLEQGGKVRDFATDPLWNKDSPLHHIGPKDEPQGGGCGITGKSNPIYVIPLLFWFIFYVVRRVR